MINALKDNRALRKEIDNMRDECDCGRQLVLVFSLPTRSLRYCLAFEKLLNRFPFFEQVPFRIILYESDLPSASPQGKGKLAKSPTVRAPPVG
jgi:hypothetical protein